MRVSLPFQPRWREPVISGAKTTTCRAKRFGTPGDEFEVEGITFRIVAIEHVALRDAGERYWREEGMTSEDEFVDTWRANHPTRGYREDDAVWVHVFERNSE